MAFKPVRETAAQKYRDIPLELLFDLVFAFSIPQCSDYLWDHLTWRGTAESLVLLLATIWIWSLVSWVAITTGAERPSTRWMMLGMMLPALFLTAGVTRAFTESGWAFVVPLLLIQVVRIFWAMILSPHEVQREHYHRVLIWFIVSAPLWLMGAFSGPGNRLPWWAGAIGVDIMGSWMAHPVPWRALHSKNVPFDADHMLDRCRQFIIIALGETVVKTGIAVSDQPVDGMTLATGTAALTGTVAIWILIFGRAHRAIMGHLERTKDPIRSARFANNSNMVIVTGLIAMAVANREAIEHPLRNLSLELALMLAGGPILFLAAQGWYLWVVLKVRPLIHLIGIPVLLLAGFVAGVVPAYMALILVAMGLTGLVMCDKGGKDAPSFHE